MKIKEQFLVNTEYGINLLVMTTKGSWYQQKHHTVCYEGGGIAVWEKISREDACLLVNNSRETDFDSLPQELSKDLRGRYPLFETNTQLSEAEQIVRRLAEWYREAMEHRARRLDNLRDRTSCRKLHL